MYTHIYIYTHINSPILAKEINFVLKILLKNTSRPKGTNSASTKYF